MEDTYHCDGLRNVAASSPGCCSSAGPDTRPSARGRKGPSRRSGQGIGAASAGRTKNMKTGRNACVVYPSQNVCQGVTDLLEGALLAGHLHHGPEGDLDHGGQGQAPAQRVCPVGVVVVLVAEGLVVYQRVDKDHLKNRGAQWFALFRGLSKKKKKFQIYPQKE